MSNFSSLSKAANAYGISKSLLYKMRTQGEIKFYYLTKRKPLVNLDEINLILSQSVEV